jgi:hypothetical protein
MSGPGSAREKPFTPGDVKRPHHPVDDALVVIASGSLHAA